MTSPLFIYLRDNEKAWTAFELTGPEIMKNPSANNLIDKKIGEYTAEYVDKVTAQASDADPTKISPVGKANNDKFFPSGSCIRQVAHFRQLFRDGGFRKFRFDTPEENMAAYGQENPPDYPLENIKGFKLLLVGGKNDLLASPADYYWLMEQLKGNEDTTLIELELGHTSLVTPVDKAHIYEIFDFIKGLDS